MKFFDELFDVIIDDPFFDVVKRLHLWAISANVNNFFELFVTHSFTNFAPKAAVNKTPPSLILGAWPPWGGVRGCPPAG